MKCISKVANMIRTFVFFDLETTDLIYHNVMPHITEMSLIAVSRQAVLNSKDLLPRVQHKLVLPIDPRITINKHVQSLTGLSNENLQDSFSFEHGVYDTLTHFLSRLAAPVCFVAHNGHNFDYPIFQWELKCFDKVIDENILCIDTLEFFKKFFAETKEVTESENLQIKVETAEAFRQDNVSMLLEDGCDDILVKALDKYMSANSTPVIKVKDEFSLKRFSKSEPQNDFNGPSIVSDCDQTDDCPTTPRSSKTKAMQKINETTPEGQIIKLDKSKQNLFHRKNTAPRKQLNFSNKPANFKLNTIYKHLLGCDPQQEHTAEADCLSMLQCVSKIGPDFVKWADDYAKPLKDSQRR